MATDAVRTMAVSRPGPRDLRVRLAESGDDDGGGVEECMMMNV